MNRLSVCMIVKDEEELLPRCLDSIKELADEIVIVDTGSTDRTIDIASKYTEKIFKYQWNNDFAAARNESLRHATGKWILVMDADEYLSPDDYKDWNDFLDSEIPQERLAYTLPIINFTGEKNYDDEITTSPVTRLIPNFQGIQFERPIHEQLTSVKHGSVFYKKIDLRIYHTGYQIQRVIKKNKHDRNMQIFETMQSNNKLDSYDLFTLGNQYRYAKEDEKALKSYKEALENADPSSMWYSHCLVGLITLLFKADQLDQSWNYTELKLSAYSDFPDYHSIKGVHYETLGFFEEAAQSYEYAIETAERRAAKGQDMWLVEPSHSFEHPAQQLVELYFRINNQQKAIYWLSKLLNKNPRNPGLLLKLIEWLSFNESGSEIIKLLDQLYGPEDYSFLYHIALALGQTEIAVHYHQLVNTTLELSEVEQLRWAVMNNDKTEWNRILYSIQEGNYNSQNSLQYWTQIILGIVIWNDIEKFDFLKNHFQKMNMEKETLYFKSLLTSSEILEKNIDIYQSYVFSIAKNLFWLKRYEEFDQYINKVQTSITINQLANYFYSMNLVDMSLQYYSLLLEHDALDGFSLENLGTYYYNQKDENASAFLMAALDEEPGKRHLYVLLLKSLSDPDLINKYISQYKSNFPYFSIIEPVQELMQNMN